MKSLKTLTLRAKNAFLMYNAGVRPEKTEGSHLMEVLGTLIIAAVLLGLAIVFFRGVWDTNSDKAGEAISDLFQTPTNP